LINEIELHLKQNVFACAYTWTRINRTYARDDVRASYKYLLFIHHGVILESALPQNRNQHTRFFIFVLKMAVRWHLYVHFGIS